MGKTSFFSRNFFAILFLLLGLGIYFVLTLNNSYFDPLTLCRIGINSDIVKGNKDTLVSAISRIKREDPTAYRALCTHVSEIVERYCPADSRQYSLEAGCYIRGSKTIYILPQKERREEVINARMEAIKKYASFSEKYWED